jgi:hypothetical protein
MARLRGYAILTAAAMLGCLLSPFSIGQTTSPTCGMGYIVYFANGILNDAGNAQAGTYAIQNLIGTTFNGMPVQYQPRFHSSATVGNISTVLFQKLQTDPSFSWATGSILTSLVLDALNGLPLPSSIQQFLPPTLQTKLSNYVANTLVNAIDGNGIPGNGYFDSQVSQDVLVYAGSLQQNLQVLVVAHSQGNLYADAAAHELFSTEANIGLMGAFAIASVATPDISTFSGEYVTSTDDIVIGGLQIVFPAVLGPTNGPAFDLTAAATCHFFPVPTDCTGHQWLLTYLNYSLPFRSNVLAMAKSLLGSLSPAAGCSTTTVVSASPAILPSSGGSVAFSALITPQPAVPPSVPTLTGNVSFNDQSGATLCSTVAVSAGVASCTAMITTLPDTITANYADPTSVYAASSGTTTVALDKVVFAVSPPAPTVAVASTVTLSVSAADGSGNPIQLPPNLQWSSSNTALAIVASGVVTGVSIPANNSLQPMITVSDPASGATSSVTVLVTGPNWLGTYSGTACAGNPGANPNFQVYVLEQSGASLLWSDSGDYPVNVYTRSLSSNGLVASWYADDGVSLISTWTLSGSTITSNDTSKDCDNGDVFTLSGPPPSSSAKRRPMKTGN